MAIARRLAQALLVATSLFYLILCPHSKVEESFQLQAAHDLVYIGISPAFAKDPPPYDHLQYPGVVPRTFVGPLLLTLPSKLAHYLLSPRVVQFLVRFTLLCASLHAWFRFAASLPDATVGTALLLVTACQFHLPFYASRLLPNVLATIPCLHAQADWIQGRVERSAIGMTLAIVVFRCDVLLLLAPMGLVWLWQHQITLWRALQLGMLTGVLSLCVTVPIDSILWRQGWLWPEAQVFYYNTILGKSSDWGVSAWHWYWTSALPKALLGTLLVFPLGIVRLPEILVAWERRDRTVPTLDTTYLPYIGTGLAFVALYSCLGHKEVRFLFPGLPLLNLGAAVGSARILKSARGAKDKAPSTLGRLMLVGVVGLLLLSLLASLAFGAVSYWNYPGGMALDRLQQRVQTMHLSQVDVHIDVAAAMTGVSLFGQRAASTSSATTWTFSKSGYETENALQDEWSAFTHILSERVDVDPNFVAVDRIPGNPRLDLRHMGIATSDAIFILERVDLGEGVPVVAG